ncbi:DsbA family protein [Candidatus Berkelbacteria bacterium]|nr:DsbA family protein [Candidatus Berkelbacteria bacterium]
MDSTKWFVAGTIVVTIALLGVLVAFNKPPAPQPGESLSDDLWQEIVQSPTHERGDKDNEVTIVEFADLQCPACAQSYPALESYLVENPDVHYIWHHFPLSQHQYAQIAAKAAEVSDGKFFEMVGKLFLNQSEWSGGGSITEIFAGYAEELGLDREQFIVDFESATDDDIMANSALGERVGVNATPTFFVNKLHLDGVPQSTGEWQQVVDSVLNKDSSSDTEPTQD